MLEKTGKNEPNNPTPRLLDFKLCFPTHYYPNPPAIKFLDFPTPLLFHTHPVY